MGIEVMMDEGRGRREEFKGRKEGGKEGRMTQAGV